MEEFGVTVFDPKDKAHNLDWDYLAGYESQKRSIEDTVLLALNYPEIYDEITEATRVKFEQNRPKAVLFEGPPGTGKTTSAKIIAQQVNIPLIYMPIEAIMSKYYGESEKKLSEFWEACKQIGKVIIFIDEIDALAGSRDSDMHEASRRVLSTLLRKIDSFESTTNVLLICATNRKQDLDAAMLSRIDLSIKFSLPDKHSRAAIFKRYAKQMSDKEL
jgi:SpoVK/Ycf46/Vps4 family AAA+-type ATPase